MSRSPTVSFPWLNRGEEFVLPDMPMIGDDELDRLTERYSKSLVIQRQSYLLHRLLTIISIKKILDKGHVEKAHEMFQVALPTIELPSSIPDYEWTLDAFQDSFNAYFRGEVEDRYEVEGVEAANALLTEKAKELEKDSSQQELVRVKEYQKEYLITNLYWRLKGKFKTVTGDDGEVPLTRENLRTVVRWPVDNELLLQAYASLKESNGEDREKFLAEPSEEEVKLDSKTPEKSTKPSKIASPSTSARGTVVETK